MSVQEFFNYILIPRVKQKQYNMLFSQAKNHTHLKKNNYGMNHTFLHNPNKESIFGWLRDYNSWYKILIFLFS